jgi:methylated-DNA-[protein]-cysteine S-methyltransferase
MTDQPAYRWSAFDTKFGRQAAAIDREGRLVRYWLHADTRRRPFSGVEDAAALEPVRAQVAEYGAGQRRSFDLALHIEEGSDFERGVWAAMCAIPFGETLSYGAIAKSLRSGPEAARAVGVACNRNPIPLVVPCHRVVGADGKLVGFGGGIPLKRALLDFESVIVGRPRDLFASV